MTELEPTSDRSDCTLATRHFRAGWMGLAVFVVLGVVLEGMHAWKMPFFVDAGRETARLLLRLSHAHGALISLVHVAYALTVRARAAAASTIASSCLLAALVLVPSGFLLGGLFAHAGDPGLGVALVPVGALALLVGIVDVARRVG